MTTTTSTPTQKTTKTRKNRRSTLYTYTEEKGHPHFRLALKLQPGVETIVHFLFHYFISEITRETFAFDAIVRRQHHIHPGEIALFISDKFSHKKVDYLFGNAYVGSPVTRPSARLTTHLRLLLSAMEEVRDSGTLQVFGEQVDRTRTALAQYMRRIQQHAIAVVKDKDIYHADYTPRSK